ncbi:MAG: NADH-quinone oxidoreductase subunit NuoE [Anaplasmataceae bacterium]|nr:NADH-quinone oxidoreductase subunit NuoE [Anaplasmataceae bacterium]
MTEKIILDLDKKIEFKFTENNLNIAHEIISRYPEERKRSAVMPLLFLAQKQQNGNWISKSAIEHIASLLDIYPRDVHEVATFYTMYNLAPVGKYTIEVCRTTPCYLCNSERVLQSIMHNLNIKIGETTNDGLFTLIEAECLGACVNAPIVKINDNYYENIDSIKIVTLLDELKSIIQQ